MTYSSRRIGRQRPTGVKRWLLLGFLVLLVGAMLIGFPFMIVFGVSDIQHANQIRAGGVTTTAMVLSDEQDYSRYATNPCAGASVSYVTATGVAEQADLIQEGNCLPVGSTVQVVYDPSAPNVIQPVSDRGSTAGGWGGVIMGSLFTILVWGMFIRGLLTRNHPKFQARRARKQAAAAAR
jgi:hypothetical protein